MISSIPAVKYTDGSPKSIIPTHISGVPDPFVQVCWTSHLLVSRQFKLSISRMYSLFPRPSTSTPQSWLCPSFPCCSKWRCRILLSLPRETPGIHPSFLSSSPPPFTLVPNPDFLTHSSIHRTFLQIFIKTAGCTVYWVRTLELGVSLPSLESWLYHLPSFVTLGNSLDHSVF